MTDLDRPGYDVALTLEAFCNREGISYLHLTRVETVEAIRREGLKPRDGMIFVVDTALVLGTVALKQVIARDFHVFGVRHDDSWSIESDRVAEITASSQWIIRAVPVGPDRLVDLGRYRAVEPFDQFLPLPESAFICPPECGPEQRAALLEVNRRGIWLPGTLAYIESIPERQG